MGNENYTHSRLFRIFQLCLLHLCTNIVFVKIIYDIKIADMCISKSSKWNIQYKSIKCNVNICIVENYLPVVSDKKEHAAVVLPDE